MLFNTSKLLRGAASSRIPILDKERSNGFVRMIWKIQVSPLKSTQKRMQCLQSCCCICWHILHFCPSWALNTARQWHIKLTGSDTQKQQHSQIRHLIWLLFFISIPHWCISKTASTKRYVTILCKWKNCNTWLCLSMLFNTSKLLRGAASSRIPILDEERSNRFVRMIWKIQVSPLKSTQKRMQCLQSCCCICWHILHFCPSWALNTARQWHIKLTGSDTQKQQHS